MEGKTALAAFLREKLVDAETTLGNTAHEAYLLEHRFGVPPLLKCQVGNGEETATSERSGQGLALV
jgi:hypothetical protein